jgi:hypothetical protein
MQGPDGQVCRGSKHKRSSQNWSPVRAGKEERRRGAGAGTSLVVKTQREFRNWSPAYAGKEEERWREGYPPSPAVPPVSWKLFRSCGEYGPDFDGFGRDSHKFGALPAGRVRADPRMRLPMLREVGATWGWQHARRQQALGRSNALEAPLARVKTKIGALLGLALTPLPRQSCRRKSSLCSFLEIFPDFR